MNETAVTSRLASYIATRRYEDLEARTREASRHCLLDYLGVAIAARDEPLVNILKDQQQEEGGHPQATIIGNGTRGTLKQACMINGAMAHAHDYDDVHTAMTGHPTVPVAPAVMALAEYQHSTGKDLILGFTTGFDTECILGRYLGPSHYSKGFHATATLGTLGAAAGSARLFGMDQDQVVNALGIASTQAAGLKSMFGSMCKPFHAGNAAADGLFAAQLAKRGFDSQQSAIEIEQGFGATHSDSLSADRFEQALVGDSHVSTTLFKYHAACYLTHSALEATNRLVASHNLQPEDVKEVTVTVSEGHFAVCNIQQPNSGLEAKFSLRFACAMALSGIDTAAISSFDDQLVKDHDMIALRDRIHVQAFPSARAESKVEIRLKNGAQLEQEWDVAIPAQDLGLQWQKLETKFMSLVEPVLGREKATRIAELVDGLEELHDVADLMVLAG